MTRCESIYERALPPDHPHLLGSKLAKAVLEARCATVPRRYDQLQPGTPVLLRHLQDRQYLNGRAALVLSFDAAKGCYHAKFAESKEKDIAVKPGNLLQLAEGVQVVGEGSDAAPAATGSIVGSRLEATTRLFAVQGRAGDEPTWAPEAQLRLPPGTLVIITGVQQKPELNGTLATIESWDSAAGRYVLRRTAADRLKLKPSNVTLVLGEPGQ